MQAIHLDAKMRKKEKKNQNQRRNEKSYTVIFLAHYNNKA